MTNHMQPMTCAEVEAHLQDLLEGDTDEPTRDRIAVHQLECAACTALIGDLRDIPAQAATLPDLAPSRDLWAGIESRIGTEVVPFPGAGAKAGIASSVAVVPGEVSTATSTIARAPRRLPASWKVLMAASTLVAATATITWTISTRRPGTQLATAPDTGFALAMQGTRNVRLTSGPTLDQTYDREIAAIRTIVNTRLPELDSTTVATLQKNLAIIDQAIAACKTALAESPSSAFLLDQLTNAYASKLRVLRSVAGVPQRG